MGPSAKPSAVDKPRREETALLCVTPQSLGRMMLIKKLTLDQGGMHGMDYYYASPVQFNIGVADVACRPYLITALSCWTLGVGRSQT